MIPTYVISLKSAVERRANLQDQFAVAGGESIVVDAVDGRSDAFPFVKYRHLLDIPEKTLYRTQLACALSHLKVWKLFLESGDDYALILEDDVNVDFRRLGALLGETSKVLDTLVFDLMFVTERAQAYLSLEAAINFKNAHIRRNRPPIQNRYLRRLNKLRLRYVERSLIRMGYYGRESWERPFVDLDVALYKRLSDGHYRHCLQTAGAEGYFLSRAGAEKLVEAAQKLRFIVPVDCLMEFLSTSDRTRDYVRQSEWEAQPFIYRDALKRSDELLAAGVELPRLKTLIHSEPAIVRLNESSEDSTIAAPIDYS